jgi:hypothetical protein
MTEAFVQYVWQFQYFDKKELCTTTGDAVEVFNPGTPNHDGGPDFLNARIRIGDIEWIGNVEAHDNASGWRDHHHDEDPAYDNVILHVVWSFNHAAVRQDGSALPTVVLGNRVDRGMILRYTKLLSTRSTIPCAAHYPIVDVTTKRAMMDRAAMLRLEEKAAVCCAMWEHNNNDWEETLYQLLCRSFGFKVNAEPMEQLARAVPFRLILKHSNNLLLVEALLFGTAGFLDMGYRDTYFLRLRQEYQWLEKKYGLDARKLKSSQWRFLRMRPANFPTLRLAQLAAVLHHHPRIFSIVRDARDLKTLRSIFVARQSDFWLRHYRFGLRQNKTIAPMGNASIDNIIVNAIVPVLAAYGSTMDEAFQVDKAVAFLKAIPAEHNSITRKWSALGDPPGSAFDSQGQIGLYKIFCRARRCLDCNIGSSIVKSPQG